MLLHSKTDPISLAPKLTNIYEKYLDPEIEPVLSSAVHGLIPITRIHLDETGGSAYLYIFGIIAILLLLIAVISYVNLVIAQASRRSLEIGVRKTLGALRRQLVGQFLSESLMLTLFATAIGVSLVIVLLEPLNTILDLQLQVNQLYESRILWGVLGIVVFLGLLGGSYPAFFLSSFEPVSIMRDGRSKKAPLRKLLVAIQFGVVIFVLCSTGLIYNQLNFLRQKDLGFEKNAIVRLELPGETGWVARWEALRETLNQSPYIVSTSTSSFTPGAGGYRRGPLSAGGDPQLVYWGMMDYDLLETFDLELKYGRNFSRDFPGDPEKAVLVNEKLIRDFQIEEPATGKLLRWGDKGNPNAWEIVGVVKDFHQNSLHQAIGPQMFTLRSSPRLNIKVGSDLEKGLRDIERNWAQIFSEVPFEYRFLDELIQERYTADRVRGKIFFLFSLITVTITFLGLFGLASYLATQRTKEIGIRRVIGAGLRDIVYLLTKDFILWVLIAALPGSIAAWYVVEQWLENFEYQAGISYSIFGIAVVLTLVTTIGIIGWHAARAARLNPSEALKAE